MTFNQGVRSSNLRWVTKLIFGEVSEWFKEPVLKTGDRERDRGFESHPLRHKTRFGEVLKRLKRTVC